MRFFQFCSFNVISDDNDFLLWLCVILAGNEDMILLEKDMRPRWNSPNKTLTALSTIFKFIFIFIYIFIYVLENSTAFALVIPKRWYLRSQCSSCLRFFNFVFLAENVSELSKSWLPTKSHYKSPTLFCKLWSISHFSI